MSEENMPLEKGDKLYNEDGDRMKFDKTGAIVIKKRGPIRKSLAWLIRPGYTKYGANPLHSAMPDGLDYKTLRAAVGRLTAMERADYEASQKRASDAEILKMTDREAFIMYAKRYRISKNDLPRIRRGLRVASYFNYLMNIIPISVIFITVPTSSLISLLVVILSALSMLFFTVQGMKEAWRAEQVRRRKLFKFKLMLNSPTAFFY